MTSARGPRGKLARSLAVLRAEAGLRQVEVAERTGITQARLSRAENGVAMLLPDEVDGLVRLYGAPAAQRAELVQAARDAQAGYVDARVVLQKGTTGNLQRRFAALERGAAEVRAFQPMMVLGALQTAAYAAAVFGVNERDELVRDRQDRQRRLWEDDTRRWVLVQTEGSLRWHVRSPELMAAQVEHLIGLIGLPHVELGILDWRTPIDVFPSTAFHLYDGATAVVGTNEGTAIITERRSLAGYRTMFDRLTAAAAFGDDARAVLDRIAGDYRALSSR